MKNQDGTYTKPEYGVSIWWEAEGCPISGGYGPYRVDHDGTVKREGSSEVLVNGSHGRWMPLSSNAFPPKPLMFEAGKKYRTRNGLALLLIGSTSKGQLVAENIAVGTICTLYPNGRFASEKETDFDLMTEWTDEPPKVKVPRFVRAKLHGNVVYGVYQPSEVEDRTCIYILELGWYRQKDLTDIEYKTPEFEDEL